LVIEHASSRRTFSTFGDWFINCSTGYTKAKPYQNVTTILAAEQIVRQTNAANVTLHPVVQAPPLNILCDSCLLST